MGIVRKAFDLANKATQGQKKPSFGSAVKRVASAATQRKKTPSRIGQIVAHGSRAAQPQSSGAYVRPRQGGAAVLSKPGSLKSSRSAVKRLRSARRKRRGY